MGHQDDPLDPPRIKNYQVDNNNNNLGESNMIKEKVIKNPLLLGEYVKVTTEFLILVSWLLYVFIGF